MSSEQPIVKQAADCYRQGHYARAYQLYQQAALRYGSHLFKANLALCQRRISSTSHAAKATASSVESKPARADESTVRQLAETQQLLEQYYTRCQALEYQLMDRE